MKIGNKNKKIHDNILVYLFDLLTLHVPPFLHGECSQLSNSFSQYLPIYPGGHWHVNDSPVFVQSPPFLHGWLFVQ